MRGSVLWRDLDRMAKFGIQIVLRHLCLLSNDFFGLALRRFWSIVTDIGCGISQNGGTPATEKQTIYDQIPAMVECY